MLCGCLDCRLDYPLLQESIDQIPQSIWHRTRRTCGTNREDACQSWSPNQQQFDCGACRWSAWTKNQVTTCRFVRYSNWICLILNLLEDLHTLPVIKMGDYQEYAKKLINSKLYTLKVHISLFIIDFSWNGSDAWIGTASCQAACFWKSVQIGQEEHGSRWSWWVAGCKHKRKRFISNSKWNAVSFFDNFMH